MYINCNGIKINYITEGQGRDVVILHGWGASIATVMPIVNLLKADFHVIAPDLPGFGLTAEPSFPFSVKDYADTVSGFLDALDIKTPILIGHSNGGRIILYLTANYDIKPRKIILVDSAGIKAPPSAKKSVRSTAFKFTKSVLTVPLWKSKTEKLLEKARVHFGSEDYKNASPLMRKTMVKLLSEDLTPILPKIKTPTLLIWGECDTATPIRDAKIMESAISNSGLVVLKGAGHFSYLEQPYIFNTVVENFLSPDKIKE
ncbi:MAG: alpha/beta hydrolase [Bacillota bacterium]|nr:alpha/beta hydrolase [Bacillota bacterium]